MISNNRSGRILKKHKYKNLISNRSLKNNGIIYKKLQSRVQPKLLKSRFLGGILKGVGSEFRRKSLTQEIKFTTSVTNEQVFRDSINMGQEAIAEAIMNITRTSESQMSQSMRFTLGQIVSTGNVRLNLSSRQEIEVVDITKLTLENMTEIVSQVTSDVMEELRASFELQQVDKMASSGVQTNQNNILSSILGAGQSAAYDDVRQVINNNLNIRNSLVKEHETTISNITRQSQMVEIVSQLSAAYSQELEYNIGSITAADIDINLDTSQTITMLVKAIKDVKLLTKIFAGISNSQLYEFDTSVMTAIERESTTEMSMDNQDETVTGMISEVGNMAQSTIRRAIVMPIVFGLLAITVIIMVGIFFMRRGSKKKEEKKDQTPSSDTVIKPTDPPKDDDKIKAQGAQNDFILQQSVGIQFV